MPSAFRPSILARTGSKSTNHDLKSARAIASSVSFIRRFSSILSSSVPRMWAMARCSERGGTTKGNADMISVLRLNGRTNCAVQIQVGNLWGGRDSKKQTTALFSEPSGVAIDSSGNLFVADNGNDEIREISPSGTVTTLAGLAGVPGTADGTGTSARFYDPQNITYDGNGNLYVVDGAADTLRKVVIATGAVTTLAGSPN